MHVSYWEGFLKEELRRCKFQKSANMARAARAKAWKKVADNIRKSGDVFMPTYYFYDKSEYGRRIFMVRVDIHSGRLEDVDIIEDPTFVVTDINNKPTHGMNSEPMHGMDRASVSLGENADLTSPLPFYCLGWGK